MSSSPSDQILRTALAVLASTVGADVPQHAAGAIAELTSLVELRGRLLQRIARFEAGTNLIVVSPMLQSEGLRECFQELDERLHAATQAVEQLLRRSA